MAKPKFNKNQPFGTVSPIVNGASFFQAGHYFNAQHEHVWSGQNAMKTESEDPVPAAEQVPDLDIPADDDTPSPDPLDDDNTEADPTNPENYDFPALEKGNFMRFKSAAQKVGCPETHTTKDEIIGWLTAQSMY